MTALLTDCAVIVGQYVAGVALGAVMSYSVMWAFWVVLEVLTDGGVPRTRQKKAKTHA